MPHTTMDRFPDFSVASLPVLMILSSGRPSIEKAREYPRIFIESRYIKPFRSPHFPSSGVYCSDEYFGKTIAAYSDIRRSLVYPRLTSRIEVDVLSVHEGWMLMARAQHGNQESIGGIFKFSSYLATCLHAAAWLGFCRRWIGRSWEGDTSRNRVWATKSMEILDLRLFPGVDPFENPQTERESAETREMAALERLASLP